MTTVLTPGRRRIALLVVALAVLALLPSLPAAGASAYEIHFVETGEGANKALIRVEIMRDTQHDAAKQPVILTYSPYNTLGETEPANDAIAGRYNQRGYARAVADVLGTRGSTGCWDYGGAREQQSGVDVVKFLAGKKPNAEGQFLTWSNGNVGMTGVSYEGTTANMVAARGDDVPELKGIVPVAAISRWYGYAFEDGVRYFMNSEVATDEGFDTPLGFDFGFGRTVPADPTSPRWAEALQARVAECGAVDHTQHGYSRTPNYDGFWLERDYLKDAAKFRAATLVVHGWQDYNVKQEEGLDLFEAIPVDEPATAEVEGVPFKKLWMTQSSHDDGNGAGYDKLLDSFWARTLKGEDNGVEGSAPMAVSRGRTAAGPGSFVSAASWPPPGTGDLPLYLGRSFDKVPGIPDQPPATTTGEYGTLKLTPQNDGGGWTHASPGTVSEEQTLAEPWNRQVTTRPSDGGPVRGHGYYSLFQESAPLAQNVRIAGSAKLDTYVNAQTGGMTLTPLLVEVTPDGKLQLVQRGFLNLDYRNGLAKAEPKTGWQHATVEFLPQDYTFTKGSRIGLMLQGSNTVWALPGNPGMLSYAMGPVASVTSTGTSLVLPVVGLPEDPATLFE
jgi:X-Pro dipeptidyl-peptidase